MRLTRRTLVQGAAAATAAWGVGCATGRATSAAGGGEGTAAQAAGTGARAATPLRILLLGGTGFLGPDLVEVARARGHTLTLFNRGKTRPGLFPDLEKLQGDRDPAKGEGLEALEGRAWDACIDTSGYVPRIVGASAGLLAPRVGHYTFVSSISVYGEVTAPGADESTAVETLPDPTSEDVRAHYGALKALSEQAAEKAMPGRVLVVRPGLIVGPGDPTDRFTYWPVRLARGGEVLCPGAGEDPVQFVDARDLAAWMIRMVEQKATGTFNATGPERPLGVRAMLEGIQQGVGAKDARLTWVPTPFLAEQKVSPWSDLPVWVPREESGMGAVSARKAVARGLTFRPVQETARDTLAWFRTLPADRQQKLRAGLAPEREAEVLAAWHATQEQQAG